MFLHTLKVVPLDGAYMTLLATSFYSTGLSWTQSQAECQKENSNLASVPNVGIQTFIGGLQKAKHAWIGGSRPAGSNPQVGWEWLDNSAWRYLNWRDNEPNGECIVQYNKME